MDQKMDMEQEPAVQDMILLSRRPTHPGEILREDFMADYGLSVAELAKRLGISRQSVNELVRCRRAVSPDVALRLARLFRTSPQFWLNLQRNIDLWEALEEDVKDITGVKPLPDAVAFRSVGVAVL